MHRTDTPTHRRFAVAIVGGGPAGLAAAIAARECGAPSVAIVERKRQWGRPIQCAGYAPILLGRQAAFDANAVRASLDRIELYLNGEPLKCVAAPGYILRRDVLETQMAELAVRLGVRCFRPARVISIAETTLRVAAPDGEFSLSASVVIGADGPRSLLRQAMGLPPQRLAIGMEYEWPLARPSRAAEIHFAPEFGAGYAWIFPHGATAGAGLALDAGQTAPIRRLLMSFIARSAALRPGAEPLASVAGPIPVGGPAQYAVKGPLALAGDAAGQTNPLTGAGILNAILCGRLAGQAAARAALKQDSGLLEDYEREWRDLLERPLERALRDRTRMAEAEPNMFREAMEKAWRVKPRPFGPSRP